jgi:hypothetical protein
MNAPFVAVCFSRKKRIVWASARHRYTRVSCPNTQLGGMCSLRACDMQVSRELSAVDRIKTPYPEGIKTCDNNDVTSDSVVSSRFAI